MSSHRFQHTSLVTLGDLIDCQRMEHFGLRVHQTSHIVTHEPDNATPGSTSDQVWRRVSGRCPSDRLSEFAGQSSDGRSHHQLAALVPRSCVAIIIREH